MGSPMTYLAFQSLVDLGKPILRFAPASGMAGPLVDATNETLFSFSAVN